MIKLNKSTYTKITKAGSNTIEYSQTDIIFQIIMKRTPKIGLQKLPIFGSQEAPLSPGGLAIRFYLFCESNADGKTAKKAYI